MMQMQRKYIGWSAVTLAMACVPGARAHNLIANGSFEQPLVTENWTTFHAPESFDGWTVGQNSIDLSSVFWEAASGLQSVDLSGSETAPFNGSIYQDVLTSPAQQYLLRFAMAGNPETKCGGLSTKTMGVDFAGTQIALLSFDTTGQDFANMGWQYFEYELVALGSTSRLTFTSGSSECAGPTLDDVSLIPIPEPSAGALIFSACGLLTYSRRLRAR